MLFHELMHHTDRQEVHERAQLAGQGKLATITAPLCEQKGQGFISDMLSVTLRRA